MSTLVLNLTNVLVFFILLLFESFVIAVEGNMAAMAGPPCTVRSLMPGPVMLTSSMEGSCYPTLACKGLKGVAIGSCGGSNVCCVFPKTCDAVSSQNHTYFTNVGYPGTFNGSTSCTLTIHKAKSAFRICQLRLDFVDFELARPNQGNCNADRFVVSGQNSNSVVPPLCGRNTNQHIYMDVDGAQGPFTLRITTSGSGLRRWNIKVTQIECVNPSRAPPHCLQHMTGPSGTFWSFNYDWPTIRPLSSQSSVETESQEMSPGADDTGGYMNGLDYTICFRKEVGFCTQTYHVNTSHSPFELPNIDDQGRPTFDPSSAGAGAQRCLYDFVLLNSLRFCGSRLNLAGINKDVNVDHPVIDTSSGPFSARFVSDHRYSGRGFRLNYQQNPCGSHIPPNSVQPNIG